jgi:uncharacterized membrane protein HdeD (DUF308 family)
MPDPARPVEEELPTSAASTPISVNLETDMLCTWFTLTRPSWHSVIFYVGAANLLRTVLLRVHPETDPHPHTHYGAYALCAGFAIVIGQLIERARSRLTSRVCSALLGLSAMLLAVSYGQTPALPLLVATAVILAATGAGEAAFRMLGTRRPSWHSVIFFIGSASVTRTLLAEHHPAAGLLTQFAAYGLCVGFALLVAALMRRAGDLTARVHSGGLGLTGLLLAVFHGDLPPHAPIAATALIVGITFAGELAYRARSLR